MPRDPDDTVYNFDAYRLARRPGHGMRRVQLPAVIPAAIEPIREPAKTRRTGGSPLDLTDWVCLAGMPVLPPLAIAPYSDGVLSFYAVAAAWTAAATAVAVYDRCGASRRRKFKYGVAFGLATASVVSVFGLCMDENAAALQRPSPARAMPDAARATVPGCGFDFQNLLCK